MMAGKEGLRRRNVGKTTSEHRSKEGSPSRSPGVCRLVCRAGIYITVALAGYLFYAYITSPISSIVIDGVHDVRQLKWQYDTNNELQRGTKLFRNLKGAESVVVDKSGNWYAGLEDGRLMKITNGGQANEIGTDITDLVGYSAGEERKIKRLMGMRYRERLYFADAYHGIFALDTTNYKWEKIVGFNDVSPPMAHTNDLTISKDGNTIFFTDATSRWHYHEIAFSHISGECAGRVFKINMKTKKIETILDKMCFPNGIQITTDEKHLLISENARGRILLIDAKSGKTVKTLLLPGGADNIRPAKGGGYWTAIPTLHDPVLDAWNNLPFIRDIIAKILGSQGLYSVVSLKKGIVVKLNEEYDVEKVYYDQEGKVAQAITHVEEYEKGKFLLGSFIAHGIVKMDGLE